MVPRAGTTIHKTKVRSTVEHKVNRALFKTSWTASANFPQVHA